MAGKLTIPCTEKQYDQIINALLYGVKGKIRINTMVANVLQTEANTGLRVGDVLRLRMDDIILMNGKYRFNFVEQKTGKKRIFYVQNEVIKLLKEYCKEQNIPNNERIFKTSVRNCQKQLKKVCDYYEIPYISTHSFRKMFATRAYEMSGHDIELVRKLMQHSSTAITIKYLGIQDEKIEKVLRKITRIIKKEE